METDKINQNCKDWLDEKVKENSRINRFKMDSGKYTKMPIEVIIELARAINTLPSTLIMEIGFGIESVSLNTMRETLRQEKKGYVLGLMIVAT